MARGWESKEVEGQIEAAEERRLRAHRTLEIEEDLGRKSARESIELSRERILRELSVAVHPRHQEQLRAALAFLDTQLQGLV